LEVEQHLKPFAQTDADEHVGWAAQSPVDSPSRPAVAAHTQHSNPARGDDERLTTDIPDRLRPVSGELSIWRAFLAEEIEAILRDGD
jgi:hypothetical protein